MKNIALIVTSLLAGVAAYAQGPVYSVNIVGFQRVDATNQFTQISNPFEKANMNINEIVGDQLTGGVDFNSADNLLFWNGSSYDRYFLADVPGNPLDGKWVDENLQEATVSLAPGQSAWIKLNGATNNVVVVGDVVSAPTVSIQINPGFNMLAYPYSTSSALNATTLNLNKAAGCVGGVDFNSADNIYVWDGVAGSYVRYFLADVPGNPLDDKWVDENLLEATVDIESGTGFWYLRQSAGGSFTWVTTKPY